MRYTESMKQYTLSRRDFLKGIGALAGIAGLKALFGCNSIPSEPLLDLSSPDQWTPGKPFALSDFKTLTKAQGGEFRILQLADTQLNGNATEMQSALDMITKGVEQSKPQLLVLTGDQVEGMDNEKRAGILISHLDSLGVPYAMTMGNHDGEGVLPNPKIGELYASGKNSLFEAGPGNVHGTGNYGLNITDSEGNVLYALIMLDSNRYRSGGKGYDYIYSDQIDWYSWYVHGINEAVGKTVPSMLFFHIPLPELNDIKAEWMATDPAAAKDAFREPVCCPAENTGLFARAKSLGSTTHIIVGHDHVNLLDYDYQGIHCVYGLKTGPCSYSNTDRQGTTLITIKDDLSVCTEFNYIATKLS
jgi:hypothetical protein